MVTAALLLAYSNSFSGPFVFDDASSILENPSVRSFRTALFPPGNSGLTVSGRPVLNLTIAGNYIFGGGNVFGYHAVNLAIHLVASLLLLAVVRRSLRLAGMPEVLRANANLLALTAVCFWALHPLQTESVTYIIQRAESLVGLLYLATFYCVLRAVDQPTSTVWQRLAILCCALGMAAKEVMATAPLLIALFDRAYVSGGLRKMWQDRRNLYVGLAATWVILIVCVASSGGRSITAGFGTDVTPWSYALTQCYAVVVYLGLVVWPHPQVLDYGGSLAQGVWEVWPFVVAMGMLLAGTVFACRRWPRAGFLSAAFFILLSPSSSIVPVATQTIAEHRMYLPLAAISVALALGMCAILGRKGLIVVGIISVVMGSVTHLRNRDYRSVVAIWRQTAENRPQNPRALYAYGVALLEAGDETLARRMIEKSLELKPDNRAALIKLAELEQRQGDPLRAVALLKAALVGPDLARLSEAYEGSNNLGVLLGKMGEREEGMRYLKMAIDLNPEAAPARFNLGNTLVALGRVDEAIIEYRAALATAPENEEFRANLAEALLKLNRVEQALAVYEGGLKPAGNQAAYLTSFGSALLRAGRTGEAKRCLEDAVRLAPDYAPAHVKLGLAYSASGDEALAVVHYEAAIKAGHKDPVLLAVAGRALLVRGRTADGLAYLEAAVAIAPQDVQLRMTLARSFAEVGRLDDATRLCEALIVQGPQNVHARSLLAALYARSGRRDAARLQLQKALEIAPSSAELVRQLELLNESAN